VKVAMDLHHGEEEVLSFDERRDSVREDGDPRQQQQNCEENGKSRFELGFLRAKEAIWVLFRNEMSEREREICCSSGLGF